MLSASSFFPLKLHCSRHPGDGNPVASVTDSLGGRRGPGRCGTTAADRGTGLHRPTGGKSLPGRGQKRKHFLSGAQGSKSPAKSQPPTVGAAAALFAGSFPRPPPRRGELDKQPRCGAHAAAVWRASTRRGPVSPLVEQAKATTLGRPPPGCRQTPAAGCCAPCPGEHTETGAAGSPLAA